MNIQKKIDDSKLKNKNNSEKKKSRIRDNVVELLEKFFRHLSINKSQNDKLFFSCLLFPKCEFCNEQLETGEDFDESHFCSKCSRFYHTKCHKEVFDNQCINCNQFGNDICNICSQSILVSEIKIFCEKCNKIIHYNCLKIGFGKLYNRLLYVNSFQPLGNFFEKYKGFYDMTMDELTAIFRKLNLLSPPFIFTVCNNCSKDDNLKNCLIHSDFFRNESERFNYRVSSSKDLEEMRILEKFYLNSNDISDQSALYLIKWNNKNFSKYTLEHSTLIENILFFREEKLNEFNNYKYYVTDFDPSIDLNGLNLSINSLNKLQSSSIDNENFFDLFSKGDIFVPFKTLDNYTKVRDFIIGMISEIRQKLKIKILICYDNNDKYKSWKLKIKELDKNAIISRFKENQHSCVKILTEIFNLHKLKIKKNLFPYFYHRENNINKLFEDIEFNSKYVCYDILFTQVDHLHDFPLLFNKLEFNLVIYDLDKTEFKSYEKIFHFHPKCKKIFISTLPANSTVNIFNNFFDLIYHTFIIIDNNLEIMNKDYDKDLLKIYNKNEKSSDYKLLYKKYGWEIFTLDKFILDILNAPKINTLVDRFSNYYPTITFMSVPGSKFDLESYFKILDYRKEELLKKKSSKKDIVKNLSIFCSLPMLMDRNYIFNLEIKENNSLIDNKKNYLIEFINNINEFSDENQMITIIYTVSEEKLNLDQLKQFLFKKEVNKRIKLILMDGCIDNFEEFFNTSEYIIFYNFPYLFKNMIIFFKEYLIHFSKNRRKVSFFHLSLMNTIEENSVFFFYNKVLNQNLLNQVLINKYSDEDKEILLKNNIEKLMEKNLLNFKKTFNLSNELVYKDLKELIIIQYEPFFVRNYMTDFKNISRKEWSELLNNQNEYLKKDFKRYENKDNINEVQDKSLSNTNNQRIMENENNNFHIVEKLSKNNEESKNMNEKNNPSQEFDYATLISKILPKLLEEEEIKKFSKRASKSSKPSKKPNLIIEEDDIDDVTLSEEEINNNNLKHSKDVIMKFDEEQVSDKLRIKNVKFISEGFHESVRKEILNIVLNFGNDSSIIDIIYQKFDSKIDKNKIQSYLNHFLTFLDKNLENLDIKFYFFDESITQIKKNILAINKLKEFLNHSSDNKPKIIEKLILKAKLVDEEKTRDMLLKLIRFIVKYGVDFQFIHLDESERNTIENISFLENRIIEKDKIFRELISYILSYFALY